jgi:hypothetical protein
MIMTRRIVYQHTRGPWVGLRQILAVTFEGNEHTSPHLGYLHTGEVRALEFGPLPDRLAPVAMPPDGRLSKGMRLKSSDKYVLYLEA